MNFIYSDGGRRQAGYGKSSGDCVVRAISIVTNLSYLSAYEYVNRFCNKERNKTSSAAYGVKKNTLDNIMKNLGFTWIPKTFKWGKENIQGKVVLNLSAHVIPIINDCFYDVNPNTLKEGTMVYGYWKY